MAPIGDIPVQAQPMITRVGQIAIDTNGPAGSGNVDLDLHAIQSAVNALASARGARAEAWELRDEGFCFRLIPCSVGVELARRGFLLVNGQKFRLALSYAANSAVSMGPPKKRPSAKDLLENWLVRCPQQCQMKYNRTHASSCCTSSHVSYSITKIQIAASASSLSSQRPLTSSIPWPNLSVHHIWRASALGMLQIFSHTLWSLTLRRIDCDKAALLELVDAFLTPRQPQPIHWPARPFFGRASILTPTKHPIHQASKTLGRNIDAGIIYLTKFYNTLMSDSKDILSTFDPHMWTARFLFIYLIAYDTLLLRTTEAGPLECCCAIASSILGVTCCALFFSLSRCI
jgi:hypothetical protein